VPRGAPVRERLQSAGGEGTDAAFIEKRQADFFASSATMTAPAREKPPASPRSSSSSIWFSSSSSTQITQLVEHATEPWICFGRCCPGADLVDVRGLCLVDEQCPRDLADAPRPDRRDAGFLLMAMAIPEVFGAGALTFGLSYLFVVCSPGAFTLKGEGAAAKAIFGVAPFQRRCFALLIGAASSTRAGRG